MQNSVLSTRPKSSGFGKRGREGRFLWKGVDVNSESRIIHVPEDQSVTFVVKFFNICSDGCATVTELLFEDGVTPSDSSDCCGCVDFPEAGQLAKRPVLGCDCKAICIDNCSREVVFNTPGFYQLSIPNEWLGSVIATITRHSDYQPNNSVVI